MLTRRRLLGMGAVFASGVGVSAIFASCGSDDSSSGRDATKAGTQSASDDLTGGVLKVALTGDPPNLDIHQTTDSIVLFICSHAYETLFTWDAEYRPVPLLADTHEVLDDGLRHRVVLRDDVKFHNGERLAASDVITSIERWSKISGLGEGLMEAVREIEEVDDLTMDFHMTEQYGVFRMALCRQLQGCSIYPKSVLDASTGTDLSEYVGTGPYRIVEWLPDRHVRLERFDDYRAG